MVNKKNLFKILIIMVLILVIVGIFIKINSTFAKYRTDVTAEKTDVDIALWAVNEDLLSSPEKIMLSDIYPSNNSYEYTFSISNYEGRLFAQTDLEYYIKCKASTYLPLEYKFFIKNENNQWIECHKEETLKYKSQQYNSNTYQTYWKEITVMNKKADDKFLIKCNGMNTNYFKVQVKFPEQYNKEEYADVVDSIEVELAVQQVIDEYK